jgi:hypothetical protein
LKVTEMLRNTPKHQFGSNGVEWMHHNFGTPKQCIQSQTQVLHLFTCQRLVKCPETLPSLWVQWSRTDASQLRYLETVHSVPKHKFCIFYLSTVSEILRNTTKHHFGSNGDVSQLWYPEIVHSGSEHKFCILLPVEG